MRVVSWNINSVRARIDLLADVLKRLDVDVMLLQETKCTDLGFPFGELAALGYEAAHHGTGHYNGVAIVSRVGLSGVELGFPGIQPRPFDEARLLSATCRGIRMLSIYAPNGRRVGDDHWLFKLVWLERLRGHLQSTGAAARASTIVGGDFNVAPADLDLYDPSRWRNRNHATPQERAAFQALIDLGFTDAVRLHHPEVGIYTWWNYQPQMLASNRGMRIDAILVSNDLIGTLHDAWVDIETRRRTPTSDHAPVVVDLAG